MKYLLSLLILVPTLSTAQVCKNASKEMLRFESQKTWKDYVVQDPSIQGGIQGHLDENGGFHFQQLSRKGAFSAKLEISKDNKGFRQFFRYCAKDSIRARDLRSMRRDGENNHYVVSVRYLPDLSRFTNKPLAEQRFKMSYANLQLNLNPDAASIVAEYRPDAYVEELREKISAQLKEQNEFGVITLDLSGHDDFVCDLVQGKAQLSVQSQALSLAPLTTQTVLVNPKDVITVYQALTTQTFDTAIREANIFKSGRLISRLEAQRRIDSYDDKKSYDIFRSLMDASLTQPALLSDSDLQCVSDSFQTYDRALIPHNFNIRFSFLPLGDAQ
ncbi:MAG: hypothetical protein KF799_13480 [Bdellovibrionales bacterium]|nr:hypothetical protein [Bdellovibrionales bacterium]